MWSPHRMEIDMSDIHDQILKLWNQNKSGMQIAVILGVSRGVVMGHVHRMRKKGMFDYRIQPKPRVKKDKPQLTSSDIKVVPKEEPKEVTRLFEFKEPKSPIKLTELQGLSCRYILGPTKGPDTLYCGKRKARGSYCEEHHKICFDMIRTKSSKARS
jgi:hypothetical protein